MLAQAQRDLTAERVWLTDFISYTIIIRMFIDRQLPNLGIYQMFTIRRKWRIKIIQFLRGVAGCGLVQMPLE